MLPDGKLRSFEKYLLEETTLAPSSVAKYVLEVRHFFWKTPKPTFQALQRHILLKSKKYHNNRTKYAFKYFLTFQKKREKYLDIPKLKVPPKAKMQKWLPASKVKRVIQQITPGIYRDIAILQLAAGGRSKETLMIREENIDWERLLVMVKGKGNKTGYLKFPVVFKSIFKKYMKGSKGYLFLPREWDKLPVLEFERRVESKRSSYARHVSNAGKLAGLARFGTHDLRRCFAYEIYKVTPDLKVLKEALRHSNIGTSVMYLPEQSEEATTALDKYHRGLFRR